MNQTYPKLVHQSHVCDGTLVVIRTRLSFFRTFSICEWEVSLCLACHHVSKLVTRAVVVHYHLLLWANWCALFRYLLLSPSIKEIQISIQFLGRKVEAYPNSEIHSILPCPLFVSLGKVPSILPHCCAHGAVFSSIVLGLFFGCCPPPSDGSSEVTRLIYLNIVLDPSLR